MPYNYHVFIATEERGKRWTGKYYNVTKEDVISDFSNPYNKNQDFWFLGKIINRSKIDRFVIFRSKQKYQKLILPNGKSPVNQDFDYVLNSFWTRKVKGVYEVTRNFISMLQEEHESKIPTWSEYISFLGLDENWLHAVIALQLQEVAVTILSKRFGINLDKHHVEEVLGKEVKGDLTFKMKYDAFSKKVEELCKVKMPLMTKDLRGMRTQVLHKGYNPKKEETDAMVFFTTGFLQKLESLKPQSM